VSTAACCARIGDMLKSMRALGFEVAGEPQEPTLMRVVKKL
jgi:hypothetical protein